MSDLERRVAVLEARMDASGGTSERMIREMGNLQDRVHALAERVGDLREEMGVIRGEMGDLRGEIGILRGEIGDVRGEVGNLRGEMGERFSEIHKEFAVVHREIAKQTKFLLVLALSAATVVSVLHPVVLKLLR